MWLDAFKAAAAIVCVFVAAKILRRRLAVLPPAERAKFNRHVIVSMLLSAILAAALALYFLQHPGLENAILAR